MRRLGAVPLAVLAAVVTLVAVSTGIGLRQPASRLLPSLHHLATPDFPYASGPVVGVNRDFISHELGAAAFTRVAGPGPAAAPHRPADVATSRPPRAVQPRRGLFTPPGSWALTLEFAPDRETVATGGQIRYTMTVANGGSAPFGGAIVLQWHVPVHTSGALTCITSLFPAALCSALSAFLLEPGTGTDAPAEFHLHRYSTYVTIAPGKSFSYAIDVRVHIVAPPGTVLTNHAHLDVSGNDTGRITAEAAPVVVEDATS